MRLKLFCVVVFAVAAVAADPAAVPQGGSDSGFLGRWDITVAPAGQGRARYCWLELTNEGGAIKGRFNQGGGAVFPLPMVKIESGELKFEHPVGRPEENRKAVYTARLNGKRLEGTAVMGDAPPRAFTGIRPPAWPAKAPARRAGKPIELFNGKDLTGWLGQNPNRALGWSVVDGVLVNEKGANNIYTEERFRDFKLHVEFNVDPKSNSGVYLRGRYEIQVADGSGRPPNVHSQGALYGFTTPPPNLEKAPGEWQTFDITLIANRLTVEMNGTRILDNEEVPGITGGALDAAEGEPGPIMLQGDHGRIQYRKLVLTPLQ